MQTDNPKCNLRETPPFAFSQSLFEVNLVIVPVGPVQTRRQPEDGPSTGQIVWELDEELACSKRIFRFPPADTWLMSMRVRVVVPRAVDREPAVALAATGESPGIFRNAGQMYQAGGLFSKRKLLDGHRMDDEG